jgi:hypothetical protein
MRLQLIPWVWERLEPFPQSPRVQGSKKTWNLEAVLNVLKGGARLAVTVE